MDFYHSLITGKNFIIGQVPDVDLQQSKLSLFTPLLRSSSLPHRDYCMRLEITWTSRYQRDEAPYWRLRPFLHKCVIPIQLKKGRRRQTAGAGQRGRWRRDKCEALRHEQYSGLIDNGLGIIDKALDILLTHKWRLGSKVIGVRRSTDRTPTLSTS